MSRALTSAASPRSEPSNGPTAGAPLLRLLDAGGQGLRIRPAVAVQTLFILFGVVIAAYFPFLSMFLDSKGLTAGQIGGVIAGMAAARASSVRCGAISPTRPSDAAERSRSEPSEARPPPSPCSPPSRTRPSGRPPSPCRRERNDRSERRCHRARIPRRSHGRLRTDARMGEPVLRDGLPPVRDRAPAGGGSVGHADPGRCGARCVLWTIVAIEPDRPLHRIRHGRLGAVGAVFRAAPRFWIFLVALLLVWTGFNAAWNFIGLRIERAGVVRSCSARARPWEAWWRCRSCGCPPACRTVWGSGPSS